MTGILCLAALAASVWFMGPGHMVNCNHLAPLIVLATLGAFLMALCFRLMAQHKDRAQRWFLVVCLLLAASTLFSDFRYVRSYHGLCTWAPPQTTQNK